MNEQLTDNDFSVILESLKHYKMNVENYSGYQSYEFKLIQLGRVESAERKVKALKQQRAQES